MKLSEFVSIYTLERDVALRTRDDYAWIASQFNVDVDAITAHLINVHLQLLRDRGCSPSSVRSRRTKLLVLWRAAYRNGYTENRPDQDRVRKVRVPEPNPQGLTHEQTARLVEWCQASMRRRMRLVPVPAGDYLAALFLFLWSTGMRLGDALSMQFDWLQTDTVTWRQSKTDRWHTARLSPATLHAIELIRTPDRCLIWPRHGKSRTALYAMIRRAFRGAGLDGTSKYIRRGVATDVFTRGLDPGRALGHVPGSRVAIRFYVSQDAQIEPVSPTEL